MKNELFYVMNQMDSLYKQKRYQERNALVPIYRKLYAEYDFGFSANEKVETVAWGRRETARIVRLEEGNFFFIRNEKGWEMIVSGFVLFEIGEAKPADQIEYEQLILEL